MQVFLNEELLLEVEPSGLRLGELIDAVGVQLDPDQVLTSIRVGDREYRLDGDSAWERVALDPEQAVHLRGRSSRGIAEDLDSDVADALAVVHWKLGRSAEMLRAATTQQEGFRLLAQSVEELQLALVLDQKVGELRPGPRRTDPGRVEPVAEALVAAQVARDSGRIGDLIREELVPMLGDWIGRSSGGEDIHA